MLVLGTVVYQDQEAGGRDALHQAVQERLSLGVDPVQVLEHHQERLHLTLSQQETLEGVQGSLVTLGRVQGLPLGVISRHVQKCK